MNPCFVPYPEEHGYASQSAKRHDGHLTTSVTQAHDRDSAVLGESLDHKYWATATSTRKACHESTITAAAFGHSRAGLLPLRNFY